MSDYVLHNFASQQYRRVLAPALFIEMPDRIRCSDNPCMQEDFHIRALKHPHQSPGCCREANQYGTPRTEPPSALLVSLDSSEAMSEHEAARRQILRSAWRLDSEFFFRDGVVIQDRPPAREICTCCDDDPDRIESHGESAEKGWNKKAKEKDQAILSSGTATGVPCTAQAVLCDLIERYFLATRIFCDLNGHYYMVPGLTWVLSAGLRSPENSLHLECRQPKSRAYTDGLVG